LFLIVTVLFFSPDALHARSTNLNLGPKTTGVYYGLAAGQIEYTQDFTYSDAFGTHQTREEIEVGTAELRTGVSYNRWISLEARLGLGQDGSTNLGFSDTEASLDVGLYQNFFLKVKYPAYVQPYGLIGMSHTDTDLCQDGRRCRSSLDWRPTVGGGLFLPLRQDFTTGLYAEVLAYDETTREAQFNADIEHLNFGLMVGF
jgi:hypothetical protein